MHLRNRAIFAIPQLASSHLVGNAQIARIEQIARIAVRGLPVVPTDLLPNAES